MNIKLGKKVRLFDSPARRNPPKHKAGTQSSLRRRLNCSM